MNNNIQYIMLKVFIIINILEYKNNIKIVYFFILLLLLLFFFSSYHKFHDFSELQLKKSL